MYKFILILLLVVGAGFLFGGMSKPNADETSAIPRALPTQTISTSLPSGSEKIEVFVFHATRRCISCINIGKFTKAVIEEKFPEAVKSGKIVFKTINIDLLENFKTAQDYGVSGSALYINAIKDGKDNHEEDTTVWRLVTNEAQMKTYFEAKLKALL